jgi:D-aspartate ligase
VTPAVVVGGTLNSLGVVRSLARAGIPTYLACDTRFCPAGLSRHCTLLRVPDLEGRGLVDGLLSITGRIGEKAVLILSSDLQVIAVSRARAALEAHYFLALPTETMVDVLIDKAKFQAYAEEIGLRVPRAVVLDQGHDEQALDVLSMPVVLKPVDRALVLAGVERTTRADTCAEARAVARRMRCAASSVVVQEWIDGDDDDIYFTLFVCDGQARIVALFTGRKMMCDPPRVGNTALCVAATEEHQALAAQSQAFVTHSHYHGIGGLEFKRHRRTGQFVVVEPTVGRTDWQEEIATLCGVNIPAIAYRTALGEPVESVGAIDPAVAWRASIRYRAGACALRPGTRIVDGYFRRADPLPGVYSVAHWWLGASRAARAVLPSFGGRDLRRSRSRVIQTSTRSAVIQISTIGG